MTTETQMNPTPKAMIWTGRVLSALPVLMLLFSAAMKFNKSPQLDEGFAHLGWDVKMAMALGIVELVCTILYVIPQTAVLGAILLTGYMGGAIATHVRLGEQFVIQAALGILIWLGLYLRDARLRDILPLRR